MAAGGSESENDDLEENKMSDRFDIKESGNEREKDSGEAGGVVQLDTLRNRTMMSPGRRSERGRVARRVIDMNSITVSDDEDEDEDED